MFNPRQHPLAPHLLAGKASFLGLLPPEATFATLDYCRGADVMPLPNEAVQVFSKVPAVLVEIPVADIKAAYMADAQFVQGFSSFEDHHRWYCASFLSDVSKASNSQRRLPCIVTADSAEVIQDGQNRLHAYIREGSETIPVLHYNVKAWWSAHKRWKLGYDSMMLMKAAKPASQQTGNLMRSGR